MNPDLIFAGGLFFVVLGVPAVIGAFSEKRPPRWGAVFLAIAAYMLWFAIDNNPGAYTFETVPDVFVRIIGTYF